MTCIYLDAKNLYKFAKLTCALERFFDNPNTQKDKVIVLVDEIQSRYSEKVIASKLSPRSHLF